MAHSLRANHWIAVIWCNVRQWTSSHTHTHIDENETRQYHQIKIGSVCTNFAFCLFFFLFYSINVRIQLLRCLFARLNGAMQSRRVPPHSRLLKHTQINSQARAFHSTNIPMTTVAVNIVMNEQKKQKESMQPICLLCVCVDLAWPGQNYRLWHFACYLFKIQVHLFVIMCFANASIQFILNIRCGHNTLTHTHITHTQL